jgi:hypothetical protein
VPRDSSWFVQKQLARADAPANDHFESGLFATFARDLNSLPKRGERKAYCANWLICMVQFGGNRRWSDLPLINLANFPASDLRLYQAFVFGGRALATPRAWFRQPDELLRRKR